MELLRKIAQILLGAALIYAGVGHLGAHRLEFQAQVPSLLKEYADLVVLASGVVELILGVGLLALWRYRVLLGWGTALFFVAIFWGNITQFVNGAAAFGLDSDRARFVRLFFQPLLVVWAIWSTGAWRNYRVKKNSAHS